MAGQIQTLQEMINQVVKGKQKVVEKVLCAMLAGGHILLEDIPGVGKTTLAMAIAKATDLTYRRVQFTPDVLPSDLVGFSMYNEKTKEFEYREGAVFANLFLADEINRTSPKTQSALLEAMEEEKVTVDGITHNLPAPFTVIATENPIGSSGTQMLPESQLDRFMIRISMGYPSMEEEMRLIKERQEANPIDYVQEIVTKQEVLEMQEQVRAVYMDDKVLKYLSQIVDATRRHSMLSLGVSPRGTLAFVDMAKGHAFMNGRDYVLPEDVKKVAKCVLAHRLLLNGKARMSHVTAQDIVEEIVGKTATPKL